jgi:hypothetical protein
MKAPRNTRESGRHCDLPGTGQHGRPLEEWHRGLMPVQGDLFGALPAACDGITIDRDIDTPRLAPHLHGCFALLRDGQPHTIADVARAVGCTESAASARIRDLRKAKFGGHTVERQRVGGGLFTYRLIPRGSR